MIMPEYIMGAAVLIVRLMILSNQQFVSFSTLISRLIIVPVSDNTFCNKRDD